MLGDKSSKILFELGIWSKRSTARVAGGELKPLKDLHTV